jgi:hypothetical protein
MTRRSRTSRGLALLVAVVAAAILLGAPPRVEAGAADEPLVDLLVASADTPEEHKALAQYYREKAKTHRALAESHRAMANYYGGGNVATRKAGKEHCEKLLSLNNDAAAQYDSLASLHEAQAGQ